MHNSMKLGNRGQEEAPFELLIAVIVMGFVIIMGLNAISILGKEKCKGDIDSQMEKIKSSLEIVARGEGSQNISYAMPSCFTEKDSKLQITERDDPQTCSFYCGGNSYNCMLLSFSSLEYNSLKCLKISNAIQFGQRVQDDPPKCNVLPGRDDVGTGEPFYDLIDLRQGAIPEGYYNLSKEIDLYTSSPMICAYLRCDRTVTTSDGTVLCGG